MNRNIKKVNKFLYIVNFDYVVMGFVKGLHFDTDRGASGDIAAISSDGRILLNEKENFGIIKQYIEAVMKLDNAEIDTKKGFCKVIRSFNPKLKNLNDQAVMHLVMSDDKSCVLWTVYSHVCEWERERRKVRIEWVKKHPAQSFLDFLKER